MMVDITTSVNQTYWQKLKLNVEASYKFATVKLGGIIAALIIGWDLMPDVCATGSTGCISHQTLTQFLHFPAWANAIIGFLILYYARVHPESSVTPNEAAAKSMSAPQPTDASGNATP